MKTALVRCEYCSHFFEREIKHVHEAQKKGWRVFCSLSCQREAKRVGKYIGCFKSDCDKVVYRAPSDLRNSFKSFCSSSCATSVNNKVRIIKGYQSSNSEKILNKRCANPQCNKLIPNRNTYCSNGCQGVALKKNVADYYKEVVEKVQAFVDANERLPVKSEMMATYMKARRGFGTWNSAIEAAGFKPNPVLFAEKHIAKDGHKCDSLAEKIVDDWLLGHGVPHDINALYGSTRMSADFKVGDVLIEFFGLSGEVREYDMLVEKKRQYCRRHKLELIEIYPKDLFPKCKLNQILKRFIK